MTTAHRPPGAGDQAERHRRRELVVRGVVYVLVLPGLVVTALVGASVPPWSQVYGSWAAEGQDYAGFVQLLDALVEAVVVGALLWLLALCVLPRHGGTPAASGPATGTTTG